MAYSKELLEYGRQELNRRRQSAIYTLQERKKELYAAVPRLGQIENQLRMTGFSAVRAAMDPQKGEKKLEAVRDENLSLQRERVDILRSMGLPEDYLTEPYFCPLCHDEGYRNGKRCQCFEKVLKDEACRRLNRQSPLSLCDFSNFDLGYYSDISQNGDPSPKEQMGRIFQFVRRYGEGFSTGSPSLLFSGRTGLGKTHLSLAIANAVIQKGFGVVYGSAPDLLAKMEQERFSRTETEQPTLTLLQSCDLLILDDLGAEFSSSFNATTVYQLINTRLNRQLPTIISTNLNHPELLKLYGERVVSRLIGSYVTLFFAGQDVRQKKAQAALF